MFSQITLIVFGTSLCLRSGLAVPGEPVVYFPPFELRAVAPEKIPFVPGVPSEFAAEPFPKRLQTEMAHNPVAVTSSPTTTNHVKVSSPQHQPEKKNSTITVHDLLAALGIDDHEEKPKEPSHSRAATSQDYGYPSYSSYPRPVPQSYPYTRPGPPEPGYWPQSNYHDNSYAYLPPTYVHHPEPSPPRSLSLFKPLIEKLPESNTHVQPVESKLVSKVGGLISFILSLITGISFDDLGELKLLKDLIVKGIIKPLMDAKSSIKSLIGKLTIPVLSLLLVNVEMLVVIWWLWEDCAPEPHHGQPVYPPYSKPAPYPYNPYK